MLRQADKVNARGERRRQVKTLAGEKKKKLNPSGCYQSNALWSLFVLSICAHQSLGRTHPHPLPQEGQKSLSPESCDCLLQLRLPVIGAGMGVTRGAANAPAGQ